MSVRESAGGVRGEERTGAGVVVVKEEGARERAREGAVMAGMPYGLQAMLKDGHKHMQGVDEAVLKNIDAARGLAAIARTSLGPHGASRRRAPLVLHQHLE